MLPSTDRQPRPPRQTLLEHANRFSCWSICFQIATQQRPAVPTRPWFSCRVSSSFLGVGTQLLAIWSAAALHGRRARGCGPLRVRGTANCAAARLATATGAILGQVSRPSVPHPAAAAQAAPAARPAARAQRGDLRCAAVAAAARPAGRRQQQRQQQRRRQHWQWQQLPACSQSAAVVAGLRRCWRQWRRVRMSQTTCRTIIKVTTGKTCGRQMMHPAGYSAPNLRQLQWCLA